MSIHLRIYKCLSIHYAYDSKILFSKYILWLSIHSLNKYFLSINQDTTERLHFHFSLSCIGEGNGNPLQCSCLENPRDGRAESQTRLKRLSSSSSSSSILLCILFKKLRSWHPVSSLHDGEKMETVTDFIFLGSKITADSD